MLNIYLDIYCVTHSSASTVWISVCTWMHAQKHWNDYPSPLSSTFLEAIKAACKRALCLFAKSCQHNGVSSQLYCLRWTMPWTWHLHYKQKRRQQQFAMGTNIHFSQGWLVTRACPFVFLGFQIHRYIYVPRRSKKSDTWCLIVYLEVLLDIDANSLYWSTQK